MRSDTLTFLAGHRRARIDIITDRLVETIEQRNPGYRATGLVPRDDLRRSCHDNIGRVLELLAEAVRHGGSGSDVDHDPTYDAARETGRRRAVQGLPLDDVLRSFRIGGRLIWDDLVAQAHSALDAEELREIGTRLWEVVDETSAQVATAYHLHERAVVRADEQLRAELWEGVLSGRGKEPGFAHDAARLLDLPVAADYLVATAATLDPAVAESHLSPHASAWVRRTVGVVGLVALRDDNPDEALAALASVAAAAPGAAMGVSGVAHGLAEVDAAYRQALLALRAQDGRAGMAACVTTIEGLPDTVGKDLHPMQQAWIDRDVVQCGYCQPGQIMAAVALVKRVRSEAAGSRTPTSTPSATSAGAAPTRASGRRSSRAPATCDQASSRSRGTSGLRRETRLSKPRD